MDRFLNQLNVQRYRKLKETPNAVERRQIMKLLTSERLSRERAVENGVPPRIKLGARFPAVRPRQRTSPAMPSMDHLTASLAALFRCYAAAIDLHPGAVDCLCKGIPSGHRHAYRQVW